MCLDELQERVYLGRVHSLQSYPETLEGLALQCSGQSSLNHVAGLHMQKIVSHPWLQATKKMSLA